MSRLFRYLALPLFSAVLSVSSYASVIISGTRVIYPSDQKELTVKLDNVGKSPVLVQSWIVYLNAAD